MGRLGLGYNPALYGNTEPIPHWNTKPLIAARDVRAKGPYAGQGGSGGGDVSGDQGGGGSMGIRDLVEGGMMGGQASFAPQMQGALGEIGNVLQGNAARAAANRLAAMQNQVQNKQLDYGQQLGLGGQAADRTKMLGAGWADDPFSTGLQDQMIEQSKIMANIRNPQDPYYIAAQNRMTQLQQQAGDYRKSRGSEGGTLSAMNKQVDQKGDFLKAILGLLPPLGGAAKPAAPAPVAPAPPAAPVYKGPTSRPEYRFN